MSKENYKKRHELVIMLGKQGLSFREIADKTGYHENHVRKLLIDYGIRKQRWRVNRDRTPAAIELIKNGYTAKEIATELGYKSANSIYVIAKKNGLHVTSLCERKVEIVRPLRESGMSVNEIARQTGLSAENVLFICKRLGINKPVISPGVGRGELRRCKRCGKEFECSPTHNKMYCSKACERVRFDDARRMRKRKTQIIEEGITLHKLYQRDGGRCSICGGMTSWESYRIINGKKCVNGSYPSIDHVMPLSLGGSHTWENVRLACYKCNMIKGARQIG